MSTNTQSNSTPPDTITTAPTSSVAPSITTLPNTITTAVPTPSIEPTTIPRRLSTDTNTSNNAEIYKQILNKSNIVLLLWFLAIYFIVFFILKIYYNKSDTIQNTNLKLSRILDISIFLVILLYLFFAYQNTSTDEAENNITIFFNKVKNYLNEPTSIFSVILFILTFYIVIYLVKIPMTSDTKPISVSIIENIALFMFVILLIIDFFKYFLEVNLSNVIVSDSVVNYWISLPNTFNYKNNDSSGNVIDNSNNITKNASNRNVVDNSNNKINNVETKEVFNIANNIYTYDDAQSVCSAYNADLATYSQIEQSYNDGAEWCNYGWSDNQMIFFPTQSSSWNKLQKNKNTKNNCGRPGINGGYMGNPNLKFGVNCYGVKPKPTDDELKIMANANINDVIPKTPEQQLMDDKIKFWKDNADKLLVVNSFNRNKWSEY